MSKKILLIIGILAVVAVALFLILTSKPQTTGENRVGFSVREFLPFGKNGNTETSSSTTKIKENQSIDTSLNTTSNQLIPRLRKISSGPIAGAVVFNIGTTSIVRFVEKGTGNIYEARSDSLIIKRLTNTTIPKIIRAFWLPNGSAFLAQTLIPNSEIIETNFIKLNKNPINVGSENLTPFSTTIGKLPTGIKEIAIKPDSSKIFYYTVSGSSNWFISKPDGTDSYLVMSQPLTEWLPKWITSNQIIMQNKASSESVSFSYVFNIKNKTFKKIGLGIRGLSTKPNYNGTLTLASSGGTFPQLFIIDNKNITISKVNANTLADKCVWSKDKNLSVYCAIPIQIPNGNYPDIWYKGLVSTEDFIEKIDLNNDIFYNVSNLSSESGQKIDVMNLSISPDGAYLIFRNKTDDYLWMLKIEK